MKKISKPIIKKQKQKTQELKQEPQGKAEEKESGQKKNLDKTERSENTVELENGDYDSEDLALGDDLSLGDFEDPEFFEEESSEEYEDEDDENEESDKITLLYGILGSFLEYDNQNIAELLCQIRDSIDSNSKCLLRVAHEMRSLHNTYIQNLLVNTNFTEESLFNVGEHDREDQKRTDKPMKSTKITPKKKISPKKKK